MAEKRLELQRAAGTAILVNEKGGIDLSDLQATAMDVTVRLAHPIGSFGIKSMDQIVSKGFIDPILYRVLKKEWDELFDQINSLLSALNALQSLPEAVVNNMRQGLYMSATALTMQFLENHAELIEFTQLATVTHGDFPARALMAIVDDGKRSLGDLPEKAQALVERFRRR
ncbi:MAG: hypothetical protein ACD_28C00003G0004 [uncultured bacterium]|nr:MAG: hypothetical protein ACD_28C00003G0004 [uncultured bacterium]KKT73057.1 MAG: hypothetical protein UW70_C0092G0007 [Candidatus Peregrinibacteria bacterium GW2011_GWA2_44_7]